jgi:serine/threonine protein kinase
LHLLSEPPADSKAGPAGEAASAHSSWDPPKPSDFRVVKLLNSGGFGAVFLVEDERSHTFFAAKVIKRDGGLRRLSSFLRERNILALSSSCPFVSKLYYSFATASHLFLIMEFLPGGDCFSLLQRQGRLPLELAKHYAAELVLAISHLHSLGVMHRDIKPDNVSITRSLI